MKSIIEYEYGIDIVDIKKQNNKDYIKDNSNNIFILEKTMKSEYELNYINESGLFYVITKRKNGNYIIEINGEPHILYKLEKGFNNRKRYFDGIQRDWGKLWSSKIDKLRKELITDNLNEYIDYYIGLAENAILIWNKLDKSNLKYKICRIRMDDKIINNPNNAMIDIEERDLAEYIKYTFFNKKEELNEITEKAYQQGYDMKIIYSRLLFATYYFDLIEDYLINKKTSHNINRIIKKQREYEEYLNEYIDKYIKKT